jgi:hypothetical protein
LNHYGTAGHYCVSRFHDDGQIIVGAFCMASPSGAVAHYAWPSAVDDNGVTNLYAMAYEAGAWNKLYLFTSTNNVTTTPQGVVFQADATEPYGISQPQITYDPTRPTDPWVMVYVVRGASGPGDTFKLATSANGRAPWTRQGVVLTKSGTDEAYGLSLGYICKKSDSEWAIFYVAFDTADLMHTTGKVAVHPSLAGPFTTKTTIIKPDGKTFTLASAAAGNGYGTLTSSASVTLGLPMVVQGTTQATQEVLTPIRQDGATVYFNVPFRFTHTNRPIHSSLRNKVAPSYAQEQPDGSWKGIFTTFGAAPGLASEYTSEFVSPTLQAIWTPAGTGLRFKPWLDQGLYSTENPTPLVSNPSCSN